MVERVNDDHEGRDRRGEPVSVEERYVAEIIATAGGFLKDKTSIGDLKIINSALKEMRYAFRIFAPYRNIRKVSIFGSARIEPGTPVFEQARAFAQRVADAGFMVITGAGPGIMEACQRGAGRDRSFGINIRLPFEQAANAVIQGDPKLMTFKYFFARKLFFLKEANAAAMFPGGFGTLDEGFESLTLIQTGKAQIMPLVFIDEPGGEYWKSWERYVTDHLLARGMISEDDLDLFLVTRDVDEAAEEIRRFYRVYHSSRYVGRQLAIRLNRLLPDETVVDLNREFRDIVASGEIAQRGAFDAERSDPEIFSLPRLAFHFDRIHFSRLRMLINRLNAS